MHRADLSSGDTSQTRNAGCSEITSVICRIMTNRAVSLLSSSVGVML
nr:TPA_asm: m84.5 sORF [Murid betaherpesvirus 1]DBA07838.1 TPA_asm: m84.5 sORF [Murid betaherpesvirus 1]